MSITSPRSRGSVLWVALLATVVAMSVALSLLQTSVSNSKAQDVTNLQANAFFATHGAVNLVMSDYYGRFNYQAAQSTANQQVFAKWLADSSAAGSGETFTAVPGGSGDLIAEDFRTGPASYTVATNANGTLNSAGNPTKDATTIVTRAVPTKFNNLVMGDRRISAVRVYKKERPQPGIYLVDLMVVVETQKNVGATVSSNMQASYSTDMLQPQWESQMFTFSSPPTFNGFEYGVLTKNLSCTLCHMQVRNLSRMNNLNNYQNMKLNGTTAQATAAAKLLGTSDRIKVGITENLTLRQNSMYSLIEGTIYQRGELQYESSHATCTPAQFDADQCQSVVFNSNATTIAQQSVFNADGTVNTASTTGATTPTVFVNQTTDSSGKVIPIPAPYGNAYLNYGTTTAGQSDGTLPSSDFPSPFPEIPTTTKVYDNNGTLVQTITGPNNQIDTAELNQVATNLVSAVNPSNPSTITGGTALFLQKGTVYQGTTLPTSGTNVNVVPNGSIDFGSSAVTGTPTTATPGPANLTSPTTANTVSYTGNVILTGTTGNPIKIDGKVVIDGDVVIRGYVQGTGQLYATGNIYMPGDVIYNNKNVGTISEQFGIAPDNTTTNLVGYSAGKNIVIGDYLSQITTYSSSDANMYQGYRFNNATNQLQFAPGQPEPGKKVYYAPGDSANNYVNTSFVGSQPTVYMPANATYPDGSAIPAGTKFAGSNEPNFIMQQVALFNRDELMKTMKYLPTKDPTVAANYLPANGAITNDGTAANSPAASAYNSTYIPKFYSMYPYDPNNKATNPPMALIYNGSTYTTAGQTWNGVADPHGYEYMTSVDAMPSGLVNGVQVDSISPAARYAKNVINISPDWIAPATMLQIISNEQASRVKVLADGQYGSSPGFQLPDRRLDGVMYTKNAIFCIERSTAQSYNSTTKTWSKVNSISGGHLQVNGAMIAPDTGILVNGGATNDFTSRKTFIVNYDARAKNLMALTNQNFNSFSNWGMTRVSMVRNTGFAPAAP